MNAVANNEQRTVRPQPIQNEREREHFIPRVNIVETDEQYIVEADLPGVSKDGLEITVEDNELTIFGRRNDCHEVPNAQVLYQETRPGDFRRVFELDPAIDTSKINAKMQQGVLTLTLPKAEKVKPRKITVGE
ncbi:MAG: hspA [Verrucomicrobiales bacterium]|nr:hspA [Verrucomicrobiales bacterium]